VYVTTYNWTRSSILSHLHLSPILKTYTPKIYLNVILLSLSWFSKWATVTTACFYLFKRRIWRLVCRRIFRCSNRLLEIWYDSLYWGSALHKASTYTGQYETESSCCNCTWTKVPAVADDENKVSYAYWQRGTVCFTQTIGSSCDSYVCVNLPSVISVKP
jgi:hypothetical protein